MSSLEKLKEFLGDAGVTYEELVEEDKKTPYGFKTCTVSIDENGNQTRWIGDPDFHFDFVFDQHGKLIWFGASE